MAGTSALYIGVDFDNTIVAYDTLFHRIAVEQGSKGGDDFPIPPRTFRKGKARNWEKAIQALEQLRI